MTQEIFNIGVFSTNIKDANEGMMRVSSGYIILGFDVKRFTRNDIILSKIVNGKELLIHIVSKLSDHTARGYRWDAVYIDWKVPSNDINEVIFPYLRYKRKWKSVNYYGSRNVKDRIYRFEIGGEK